jgi:hypothetical protein
MPWADILYACDARWWRFYRGVRGFEGERWSSHDDGVSNNKAEVAAEYGLSLVYGKDGLRFSTNRSLISYGGNSGFQAVNIALHKIGWRGRILLVGFDMRSPEGKRHFFGNHPGNMHKEKSPSELTLYFRGFTDAFARASDALPKSVQIINCTPGSALNCFPKMELADALPVTA